MATVASAIKVTNITPAIPEWLTSVVDGERVPLEISAPNAHRRPQ